MAADTRRACLRHRRARLLVLRPRGAADGRGPLTDGRNLRYRRWVYPECDARPFERRLVVVPAYNEEHTVGRVIRAMHRDAPSWDVSDRRRRVHGRDRPARPQRRGRGAAHPFNLGIGGAMQSGFLLRARGRLRPDGAGRCGRPARPERDQPAARSTSRPPGDRHGVRLAFSGGRITAIPLRSAAAPASTCSRSSLSRIVGQRVSDPTSGFRLYNRRAIELFARDYPHDYPEVEAVLMLHHHRLSMREEHVRMYERGGGVSSISSGKSLTTWSRCCWPSVSASCGGGPWCPRATPRQ